MHSRWKPCLSWEHTASSQHVSRWKIVSNEAGHLKIVGKNDKNWLAFQKLCWSSLTLSNIPDLFCWRFSSYSLPWIWSVKWNQVPVVTSFAKPPIPRAYRNPRKKKRLKDLDFEAKERPGLRKFLKHKKWTELMVLWWSPIGLQQFLLNSNSPEKRPGSQTTSNDLVASTKTHVGPGSFQVLFWQRLQRVGDRKKSKVKHPTCKKPKKIHRKTLKPISPSSLEFSHVSLSQCRFCSQKSTHSKWLVFFPTFLNPQKTRHDSLWLTSTIKSWQWIWGRFWSSNNRLFQTHSNSTESYIQMMQTHESICEKWFRNLNLPNTCDIYCQEIFEEATHWLKLFHLRHFLEY